MLVLFFLFSVANAMAMDVVVSPDGLSTSHGSQDEPIASPSAAQEKACVNTGKEPVRSNLRAGFVICQRCQKMAI